MFTSSFDFFCFTSNAIIKDMDMTVAEKNTDIKTIIDIATALA